MQKGATKLETTKTIAALERQYRKTKVMVWLDLAERLKSGRRRRKSINLWKLEKMAKKFSGKTLVVPGKILGTGEIKEKATVVALEYSAQARKKISEKGHALNFPEALKKAIKPSTMVIVE